MARTGSTAPLPAARRGSGSWARRLQGSILGIAIFALLCSALGVPAVVNAPTAPSNSQIVVNPSTPQPLPVGTPGPQPSPTPSPVGSIAPGVPPPPATSKFAPPAWAASNPPTPRQGAAFAYDPKLGVDILFGGQNGSVFLGDTWEFNNYQWIQ